MSFLSYYKLLFLIEIFVAEFLFTFKLKKRKHFVLKFIIGAVLLLIIALLFPNLDSDGLSSSLMFFILFALTIPWLMFLYDEHIIGIIFCSIAAYTVQHFTYEMANLFLAFITDGQSPLLGMYGSDILDLSTFNEFTLLYILIYLFCYITTYWILFVLFGKKIVKGKPLRIRSISLLFFIGVGLITNVILNAITVYSSVYNGGIIDYIKNMMCCILLLFSQFSLLSNRELETELEIVHHLRYQEKKQYALSKENIDIINRKCHDMKHQIRKIGKNKELSKETIKEMEESIDLYDSIVKTGNETLDVILTEKSLICLDNNIILSYIADGEKLSFIKETDLYSLFGNALDNAIEAVLKINEISRRIIGIKIRATGDLITINISNTFDGEIILNTEGVPITTKKDKNYHGFGLKSISYIVSKYDGSLSFNIRDKVFNINILFPLK